VPQNPDSDITMQPNRSLINQIAHHWKQNEYYDRAEFEDWLAPFWGEHSDFLRLFGRLDPTSLVELACGHGRHTEEILKGDRSGAIRRYHLLDINQENIDYCRQRFANEPRIRLIINNGRDFRPLASDSVSSIFCFDAMVHFEYDCVISYINDAFRILKPGGHSLLHHSNYTAAPGSQWLHNAHGRNFMSQELFSHVAQRAGFNVLEQVILDWGDGEQQVKRLDCLSLLEKPSNAPSRSLPSRIKRRLRRLLSRS
jgi:SAM-dependent methyltransferase